MATSGRRSSLSRISRMIERYTATGWRLATRWGLVMVSRCTSGSYLVAVSSSSALRRILAADGASQRQAGGESLLVLAGGAPAKLIIAAAQPCRAEREWTWGLPLRRDDLDAGPSERHFSGSRGPGGRALRR